MVLAVLQRVLKLRKGRASTRLEVGGVWGWRVETPVEHRLSTVQVLNNARSMHPQNDLGASQYYYDSAGSGAEPPYCTYPT